MEALGLLDSSGGKGRAPREFSPVIPSSGIDPGGYSPRNPPNNGAIPYPGGKTQLAEWIIGIMPVHDTYVEVFGGGAGVLFNKPRSKYEIYNDTNDDLTQFFSVVRDRCDELASWLSKVPYSRSQYEEWVTEFYDGVRPDDPIERAGRFFTLRYMQYAGVSSTANGFKVRARRSPARTFDNARKQLYSLAERFAQVTIENMDYRELFETYDDSSADVLFYLDPPYATTENHYSGEFDNESLIDCLSEVQNDWILSCKDVPEQLRNHTIRKRSSRHRMKRGSGDVTERLVCNFDSSERSAFT
jgi:DNA adenine methylase